MTSTAIGAIENSGLLTGSAVPGEPAAAPGFATRLQAELDSVNTKLIAAETGLRDLASGQTGNIHHVMLNLEEARLSFQLLLQVRNKVLESYQELMRMQV